MSRPRGPYAGFIPSIATCSALLLGGVHPAFAHRDDYINETFVFQTLSAREFEPEVWLDLGRDREEGASFRRYAAAFEYGITNHWMVDGFVGWLDRGDGGTSRQRLRAESRVRFGEEGERPVDVAASFEVESEREDQDAEGTTGFQEGADRLLVLTPRLVLSRDFRDQLNLTLNLDLAREFHRHSSDRWTPGYAVAARYPREAFLRYGGEFRQDFGEDHSSLLVPQLWFSLPHEATLKLGVGRALEGESRQDFARVVFEIEF